MGPPSGRGAVGGIRKLSDNGSRRKSSKGIRGYSHKNKAQTKMCTLPLTTSAAAATESPQQQEGIRSAVLSSEETVAGTIPPSYLHPSSSPRPPPRYALIRPVTPRPERQIGTQLRSGSLGVAAAAGVIVVAGIGRTASFSGMDPRAAVALAGVSTAVGISSVARAKGVAVPAGMGVEHMDWDQQGVMMNMDQDEHSRQDTEEDQQQQQQQSRKYDELKGKFFEVFKGLSSDGVSGGKSAFLAYRESLRQSAREDQREGLSSGGTADFQAWRESLQAVNKGGSAPMKD